MKRKWGGEKKKGVESREQDRERERERERGRERKREQASMDVLCCGPWDGRDLRPRT